MKINVTHNIPEVAAALRKAADQVPFALSVSLNAVAEKARMNVRAEMSSVFDRPTPWVLNSLRVKRATKQLPEAELAFKDRNVAEATRSIVEPHVFGGRRHYKAMEAWLMHAGFIPRGYTVVPGSAAQLDANGNMSQGQIKHLISILNSYTDSGFTKANIKAAQRLAKGNEKKNVNSVVYWVNRVGVQRTKHLMPGVYKRTKTGFGSSLQPMLIFVKQAVYKKKLGFEKVVRDTVDREFVGEFDKAFEVAYSTRRVKT